MAPNCRYCARPMLEGTRDGVTMEVEAIPRLNKQMAEVYEVVKDGRWRTPHELEELLAPVGWSSINARLRDFRKPRFGGYQVERRSCGGGLFEYRLVMEGQE